MCGTKCVPYEVDDVKEAMRFNNLTSNNLNMGVSGLYREFILTISMLNLDAVESDLSLKENLVPFLSRLSEMSEN